MSNNLYFEDVDIGDEIGPITKSVSDDDVIQFVSISFLIPENVLYCTKDRNRAKPRNNTTLTICLNTLAGF